MLWLYFFYLRALHLLACTKKVEKYYSLSSDKESDALAKQKRESEGTE